MTAREVKKEFIRMYYGNRGYYNAARRKDYCKVQFEWSCFIDGLCKDGVISQYQYNRMTF